ncbi:hypothetical protein [Chthonobacter albigriseus]|uniref:hypothetical protein n=1 Tax=Chthonobacter albigriseus TaxID=1683161 RepID=UPI0015EFA25E|nr:hypothetical protein [Chthonobacter albigriseus]
MDGDVPSTITLLAGLYAAAGFLVMAGTVEDLRGRRWRLSKALAAGWWVGLLWPVTLAVLVLMKALQAPSKS